MFKNIDPDTGMASNSAVIGLLTSGLWLVYFYGANLAPAPWFQIFGLDFNFDSSELPIITLYLLYIPIFLKLMSLQNLSGFKRYVAPALAILCSLFMCFACIYTYKIKVVFYLIVFVVLMGIGAAFKGKKA